jgi:hypothetical protein
MNIETFERNHETVDQQFYWRLLNCAGLGLEL